MDPKEAIRHVREANAAQIDDILEAAIRRKRELYPEWEIFYWASRKGSQEGLEEWIRRLGEFGLVSRERECENAWEGRGSVRPENT